AGALLHPLSGWGVCFEIRRARRDAAVARQIAHRGVGHRRLAAPGLTDQAVRLASSDGEGHAADRLTVHTPHAIRQPETGYRERRDELIAVHQISAPETR